MLAVARGVGVTEVPGRERTDTVEPRGESGPAVACEPGGGERVVVARLVGPPVEQRQVPGDPLGVAAGAQRVLGSFGGGCGARDQLARSVVVAAEQSRVGGRSGDLGGQGRREPPGLRVDAARSQVHQVGVPADRRGEVHADRDPGRADLVAGTGQVLVRSDHVGPGRLQPGSDRRLVRPERRGLETGREAQRDVGVTASCLVEPAGSGELLLAVLAHRLQQRVGHRTLVAVPSVHGDAPG